METCASCGTALGAGRFCTHCGERVDAPTPRAEQTAVLELDDWRTGTAERPAVGTAPTPPAAVAAPPPLPPAPSYAPDSGAAPRFPLFADQVEPGTLAPPPSDHHGGRPAWLPWAVGGAVLLLVAVLGGLLLGGGDDDQRATDAASSRTDGSTQSKPEGKPTSTPSHSAAPGESGDVARFATVQVPATAPPNQDVSGNMVRYEGRNMLDGVADTCWRMTGDGTGSEITVQLDGPTTLTQVGMINGYAKSAVGAGGGTLDWYHGNRRIMAVEWSFDDGTSYSQTFEDTQDMQTLDIEPVTTSTVTIRLVSVSAPGTGRAARNNTAISDLTLVGTPS